MSSFQSKLYILVNVILGIYRQCSMIRPVVVVIDHRTRIIDPAKKTEYHVIFDMTHLTAGFISGFVSKQDWF